MKWIRNEVLSGKLMAGCFLNLGSGIAAEIAGKSGFDWVLVDIEHGSGDYSELVPQLQALAGTPAAALVRVAWNEAPRFKRVLDLGPSGAMIPYVNSASEAEQAVSAMRYPPQGVRGVASFNRACGFGQDFEEYFARANEELLTIVQVETAEAVKNAEEIAAVDGVDVLFIGPLDLSVNLGHPKELDHPDFRAAVNEVVAACRQAGKAPGILLASPDQLDRTVEDGFTFIGLGSDGGAVAAGLSNNAATFDRFRQN